MPSGEYRNACAGRPVPRAGTRSGPGYTGLCLSYSSTWVRSSIGRALESHSRGKGFESPRIHNCPVSRHRGHLLQDIVDRPAASETVVVSIWLESQRSEEFTVLGDDADVGVGDEKVDLPVLVGGTDADVPEPAEVAQGDRAEAIDFVAADAMVDRGWLVEGLGFDECVEDGHRCLPVEGAVGSDVVVVDAEDVELMLQLGQRPGRPLLLEEPLQGLMKAFHLAAGLGVVGSGVFGDDAEALQL